MVFYFGELDQIHADPLRHKSHNNTDKLTDQGSSTPPTPELFKVKLVFLSKESGGFRVPITLLLHSVSPYTSHCISAKQER